MRRSYPKPSDEQILGAVKQWGNYAMTYVIANVLAGKRLRSDTPWVLRQLKRLEKAGRVKRVPSGYAVMLCWAVVEGGSEK